MNPMYLSEMLMINRVDKSKKKRHYPKVNNYFGDGNEKKSAKKGKGKKRN